MTILIFFILGLIIGSFLNVVVYRLKVAESIAHGRSHCPECRKPIKWYDNIPLLSFILLRFRCRYCRKKISWKYPLVEFFTGLLFAAVGYKYFIASDSATWITTLYYLGAISFLAVIFVYDFLYMEISDLVLWPAVAWAVAFGLYIDWTKIGSNNVILNSQIYSGVLAAFAAFAIFFLLVAVSKEKWMGMGDAYLVILLGLILGWPNIILALFLAFMIGAIVGLVLIAGKKKKMESRIPFAPFLILGALITLFFYAPIVNWYFGLFY
ncbi:MAG: prepilin peptidase [Parcubacteria group bacterium]|jgi:leader peptidase (prepilin peptidase)/N-methyltransferase